MIITNIDYVIKFKEEDNIADIDNDDNNIVIMKIIMKIVFIILLSLIIHAQIYICIEKCKILITIMEIKNVLVCMSHKGQYNIMREGRIELET